MTPFSDIQALIIDMDGVLWHGSQPLPGLIDFFDTLRAKHLRFILATNNATLTAEQYVTKLAGMGVRIGTEQILTSAMATASYLSREVDPATSRVFVIGEEGARAPLLEQGFTLTDTFDPVNTQTNADIVVCGLDRTLTWQKLANATYTLHAGAKFIGTNADTSLPTEQGMTIGNGAILAALQAATGVKPITIGKPEPIMYRQAMALLDTDTNKTIAIGDRLDTDILGAVRADIRSLMVLTGVSSEEDLKVSDFQPTWVMQDIRAITQALQKT
ncbi:HAD-IIA family hydrolase [Methylotuvimicrobium alcaliphilum]|uniref:HAD-superfamily hydrolase, subfamily IIA n=1 Tax=Methylotuvimicrobium alcaliphilum (strain DSM 19304 / NCIMB 14124 / VKM B-2133 / 20Z) TaxID=1091494 RepID=G4T0K6_META2|nr:HAD-IIA family hydrolase [Methylotuvimicrobium alcaliphilum]CCE25610.1 HAD-superfamily hydrolase, subfamily IIA [Methylotuvimicrobium alcaliphilum 20Z]